MPNDTCISSFTHHIPHLKQRKFRSGRILSESGFRYGTARSICCRFCRRTGSFRFLNGTIPGILAQDNKHRATENVWSAKNVHIMETLVDTITNQQHFMTCVTATSLILTTWSKCWRSYINLPQLIYFIPIKYDKSVGRHI